MADATDDVRTWFAAGDALQDLSERELPYPADLLTKLKGALAATPELGQDNWHPSLRAAVELISQRPRLAIDAVRGGASLAGAAHAAGFTDSAHANRVCHEMFGLSPSQASGQLVWA